MRALTVRQPWAWAIIHGGKDIENRSRNLAGSYRGPIAIHAAKTEVPAGNAAWWQVFDVGMDTDRETGDDLHLGCVIGVVDLVSVHHDSDHGRSSPCSVWGIVGDWHLALENPRPIATPVPARGSLGLWTPDADLLAAIEEGLR